MRLEYCYKLTLDQEHKSFQLLLSRVAKLVLFMWTMLAKPFYLVGV